MHPLHRRAGIGWTVLLALCAGATTRDVQSAPARAVPSAELKLGSPEQMLPGLLVRARSSGPSSVAWLSVISAIADGLPTSPLVARLKALHATGADAAEVDNEARWLADAMAPRRAANGSAGLVRAWSIAGPFEDVGGGLAAHEGPEEPVESDEPATWDRGPIEVRARVVPPDAVTARGIPLDLLVSPRAESCTYLTTSVTLTGAQTFQIHLASSGAVRVAWDGRDVASMREVHEGARFDRAAFRVEASAGEHAMLLKVCSGPQADDGLVRVHVTSAQGQPLDLPWKAGSSATAASARVIPIRTLLERVLDTGKRPPRDRALEAALVRGLGGAEDLRTPRVPGLLDGIVRDARTPAAKLALAAWVTPFGGERSGRWQLARDRAEAARDVGTQSFVLRRLAEQRLESGYADWASAALGSAPLAGEDDLELRMLRARTLASAVVLRASAVRQLTAITSSSQEVPTAWAQLAVASRMIDRRVWASAQERRWATSAYADCEDYVRALLLRDEQAAEAAALACGQSPGDADELVGVARVLVDAGRLDAARRMLEGAKDWAPNVSAYWTAVADADPSRRAAALQRAASLEPTDARIASRLALAEGTNGVGADEVDLVDASAFLARKEASPAQPGVQSERLLHWYRKVEMLDDRRVAQTLHYAREVVIAPRTPHELEEELPLEEADVEIVRARVHRAGGGIAFAEEQESDGERSRVRWPELRTGDVVEVALRTITGSPVGRRGDPPFYFVDYIGGSETTPLLYGEIVVEGPAERPLATDVLHGAPDRRTDRVENGRRLQRFVWDHPKIVADEPLSPDATEIVPTVIGSTFSSWKEFLDWYRAAVEGFTEPDEQIRALAAELTAGASTRDQKLRKLFEYVADEIRYVNFVSAEAWLPNRPQQVLARRQGDCDDKAILLIALLKAVGIEATEVLLQSRYTGQPSVLLSTKAAVPLFDHGIAYLPGASGMPGTWLDPTNPQNRLGPVPSLDARGMAVFVNRGEDRPMPTPSGAPSDHGVSATWELRLDANGGAELTASEQHAGDDGRELRGALAEKDTRVSWVEKNLLAGWMGAVRVEEPVTFEADTGDGTASVGYTVRSPSAARREGADLVVQVAAGVTLTGALAPMRTRTLPVVLPPDVAPGHEVRRIRVVPPSGFRAGDIAPGGEENGGPFGRAKLSIESVPDGSGAVLITRTLVLDQSTITVDQYAAWRGWLQRVDGLMQRSVRFIPAP